MVENTDKILQKYITRVKYDGQNARTDFGQRYFTIITVDKNSL